MRKVFILLPLAFLAGALLFPSTLRAQTPEQELEKKLEAIDITDPDALFQVADWAMKNKKSSRVRKEGRKLMKEILELDADHEDARKALGFVQFEDRWVTKKQYKKLTKEARKKEMKEKGYVPFKGGWIKKTQKRKWNRRWKKDDDDIWRSFEEIQKAKGLVLYKGAWLKIGKKDRERMDFHRKMTGEDILVVSTPHFRLHMGIKPKMVEQYMEKVEEVYDWYVENFEVPQPPEASLWPGQVDIWHFETVQEFQDWVTTYSEEYKFDDDDKKDFREHPAGYLITPKKLITIVAKRAEDIENPMIHQTSSMLLWWHTRSRGPAAAWMSEAFGHLAEDLLSTDKVSRVNCSTNSRYANAGDVVKKEFNTKDGRPTCRSIIKAGDELSLLELSKLPLNSLNGENLAQGFSVIDWLYQEHRDKLANMLKIMTQWMPPAPNSTTETAGQQIVRLAVEKGFGTSLEEFEKQWRAWVLKKYR